MRKEFVLFCSAASFMALTSCSSKLGPLSADNFSVTPNPLESQAGKVSAVIDGKFPEKYMKKKAVVTVTPELRAVNGNAVQQGQSATFQGEKVLGNGQTIQYKVGGNYSMRTGFDYEDAYQLSEMYLTFKAFVGKKEFAIPAVKVADGVIATSELYKKTLASSASIAPDKYQRIVAQKQEAEIKFLINQANLRKSELKNNSVKEFVEMLQKINADREKLNLNNVEVLAYASPEGGVSYNDKLAGKRQTTSEGYVQQQLKNASLSTDVVGNYTAQDWDGFQKLVQASNIQDKDLILRVLSMYKDPEERERQIRNMSEGFRELADGILPELRRARMIINYDVVGRSDDQIKAQFNEDAKELSVDEILYAATLDNNPKAKQTIYAKAAELYPSDYRALNNLAVLAMAEGKYDEAKSNLEKALKVNGAAAETNANLGLVTLLSGDIAKAEALIAKAAGSEGFNKATGTLNIVKGNYAQAVSDLANEATNTAALAQILSKNYSAAAKTLENVSVKDGMTDYLAAILNARQGNTAAAKQYLMSALQKDSSLSKYAANDLELLKVK